MPLKIANHVTELSGKLMLVIAPAFGERCLSIQRHAHRDV